MFLVGSCACGIAPGTITLIAARTVQAIGGAVLSPASLKPILRSFPAQKRSTIVGLWRASGALGAAIGPCIGGILIDVANWRAAFLVNLPVGVALLAFSVPRLPHLDGAAEGGPIDLPGIMLIAGGAAAVFNGVVLAPKVGLQAATVCGR